MQEGAASGRQHILRRLVRGHLIERICCEWPNKLDFLLLVTY